MPMLDMQIHVRYIRAWTKECELHRLRNLYKVFSIVLFRVDELAVNTESPVSFRDSQKHRKREERTHADLIWPLAFPRFFGTLSRTWSPSSSSSCSSTSILRDSSPLVALLLRPFFALGPCAHRTFEISDRRE